MKDTRNFDRYPLKDVRVKDNLIGARTPLVLVSRENGEYMKGDILDANTVMLAIKDAAGSGSNVSDSKLELSLDLNRIDMECMANAVAINMVKPNGDYTATLNFYCDNDEAGIQMNRYLNAINLNTKNGITIINDSYNTDITASSINLTNNNRNNINLNCSNTTSLIQITNNDSYANYYPTGVYLYDKQRYYDPDNKAFKTLYVSNYNSNGLALGVNGNVIPIGRVSDNNVKYAGIAPLDTNLEIPAMYINLENLLEYNNVNYMEINSAIDSEISNIWNNIYYRSIIKANVDNISFYRFYSENGPYNGIHYSFDADGMSITLCDKDLNPLDGSPSIKISLYGISSRSGSQNEAFTADGYTKRIGDGDDLSDYDAICPLVDGYVPANFINAIGADDEMTNVYGNLNFGDTTDNLVINNFGIQKSISDGVTLKSLVLHKAFNTQNIILERITDNLSSRVTAYSLINSGGYDSNNSEYSLDLAKLIKQINSLSESSTTQEIVAALKSAVTVTARAK